MFELERRGYLQAGAFVPEVLFDHPEVVEQLHMDFVHAGSDVTQALTYYVHREKLRVIGREQDLVPMNRAALRIAKSVARKTGTLFAGDLCNTNIYDPGSKAAIKEVERIFAEQVGWAVDAGVDYFVAETFSWGAEALLALAAIQKHSKVPAVVTMAMHREEHHPRRPDAGGGVPAPGGRRRPGGRHQLPPRTGHDHADDASDPRRRSAATWRHCRCPTAPPPRSPRSCPSPTRAAAMRAPSRSGSIRSCARARRSSTSDARPSSSASVTSGCAAGQARTTSAPSPRAWAGIRRRAATSADMSRHAFFGTTERIQKIQTDYRGKL